MINPFWTRQRRGWLHLMDVPCGWYCMIGIFAKLLISMLTPKGIEREETYRSTLWGNHKIILASTEKQEKRSRQLAASIIAFEGRQRQDTPIFLFLALWLFEPSPISLSLPFGYFEPWTRYSQNICVGCWMVISRNSADYNWNSVLHWPPARWTFDNIPHDWMTPIARTHRKFYREQA